MSELVARRVLALVALGPAGRPDVKTTLTTLTPQPAEVRPRGI